MNHTHLSSRVSPGAPVRETTAALQALIDETASTGGVVSVDPGEWEITTIHLRGGMTLRLERGAVLKAHPDIEAYEHLARGHNKDRQPYHLLYADGCEGLTVEGDGVIDGQGPAFWDPPMGDRSQGAVGLFHRHKGKRVSPLMEVRNSRDVVLRGFTLRNSPGWTLHTYLCDRVRIQGVTVDNHLFGPNTDGFDINGCRDVWVSDCELRCGDDAIILKATDDARDCERIVVTNCILESNCAALGLGAETAFAIRDVAFSNCVVRAALRMIQMEMWEAGTIENVAISNITGRTMSQVPLERPIYLDIQSHGRKDPGLGTLRNIVISNFTAETRGRIVLTAKDGACIENVTLRDIHLRYPEIEDPRLTVNRMRSSQMSNDSPLSRDVRSAIVADNVRGLGLYNVVTTWPSPDADPAEKPDGQFPGIHGTLPMHAIWARRVRDAVVDCPGLAPSQPDVEALVQTESDIEVRALGARGPSS